MRKVFVVAFLSLTFPMLMADEKIDVEKLLRSSNAFVKSNDYENAIALLKSAVEKNGDPRLFIALAEVYWVAKRKDDAISSLEEGVKAIRQKRLETGKASLRDNMLMQRIVALFKEYDPDGNELRDMHDEYIKKVVMYARRMLFKKQYRAAEKAISLVKDLDPANTELDKLIDGLSKQFSSGARKLKPGKMLDGIALDARLKTLDDDMKKANPEQTELKFELIRQGELLEAVLSDNPALKDISPLAGIPFWRVVISGSAVSDIRPLIGMPLKQLRLDSTKVTDISIVRDFPLVDLTLSHTAVKNLAPLAGHKTLEILYIYKCAITDLGPLTSCPRFKTLCASGCAVVDLSPIKNMPNLTTAYLENMDITDISAFKGTKILHLGLLGCTKLHDLTPLLDAKELQALTVPAHLKDIGYLKKHPSLKLLANDISLYPLINDKKQTPAEFWEKLGK